MRLRQIIDLGRFRFLAAGLLLYLLGALLADVTPTRLLVERIILGYMIVFCGHLSISYSNDFFDFYTDGGKRTFFSGGSGVLQKDPSLRGLAKDLSLFLIASSLALAMIYQLAYNPPIIFFLLVFAGNLLGWFYSAPPIRLSARCLGEIATTTGFLSIAGLGYLAAENTLDAAFAAYAPPLAAYGLGFILGVEIPDYDADKKSEKKNWTASQGRTFSFKAIALLHFFSFAYFTWLGQPNIAAISLLPLFFGLYALKEKTDHSAMLTTCSLAGFILALDLYLLFF